VLTSEKRKLLGPAVVVVVVNKDCVFSDLSQLKGMDDGENFALRHSVLSGVFELH